MRTPVKLGGFLAAIAAIFGIAHVIGRIVGPVGATVTAHDDIHSPDTGEAVELAEPTPRTHTGRPRHRGE